MSKAKLKIIPGPKGHWFYGSLKHMQKDAIGMYIDAHKQYGDYVKFRAPLGLKWHMLSHPDAVHHVLVKNHQNYSKGGYWSRIVSFLGGNGLFTSKDEFWLKQRKLMNPSFHRERIMGFADLMVKEAAGLVKEWDHAKIREKDFFQEMMQLTLRIIGKVIFSTDIKDETNKFANAIEECFAYVNYRMFHPICAPLWMPVPVNLRYLRARKTLDNLVYGIIHERRNDIKADKTDVLSLLMAEKHEEDNKGMTDKQLRDEVITLMIAGHETLSCTLTWTWYLLATHKEEAAKLKAELDSVLAGRNATFEDIPNLTYTRMVLDESMRLYPAVWGLPRYAIKDDEINGYKIKKGSIIAVLTMVTQRHPDFWREPDKFNPENFTPDNISVRPKYAYYPFGGGPRHCIGIQIALMEGVLVLATLFQNYQPELTDNNVEPEMTFTLKPKNGLKVFLRKQ